MKANEPALIEELDIESWLHLLARLDVTLMVIGGAEAQRIFERLHTDGKRVFAAVGALHMAGEKSVPALLAEHGFQVTKVFPAEHR
jgi:uncharacterized protein YbaP (TraB family)